MKKTIKAFAFVMFLVFVLTSCNGGGRSTSSNADTQEIIKEIYPKPQNASFGGDTFFLDKVNLKISADADVFAAERLCAELNKNGIEIDPSNSAPITLYLGHDDSIKKEIGAAKFGFASEPEGYKISVKEDKIVLLGADADGDFNAVASFCQLLNNGYIAQCEVSDYPTVPMRGVIEGFYGTPWSHADRLSMLDFMGDFKMNTMIFAPKDDLKHLSGWREYYTSEELAVFKELLSGANKNHVDFVYAISPGGDFAKGGAYAKDFDTLMKKCESLYDIGVRNFAIFLDDIYIENDSAALHAKLLNDFQVKFCETHEGCADLLTIPTVFNATDISWGGVYLQYVEELAKLLNPKVMVMSTGSAVIPAAITKEDMSAVNAPYKRKAVIWWNYPVNDYATDSLFVAPATGLSVDLPEEILGLTANPMNQAEASQIPLATTADYLWNPKQYEPYSSFESAIKLLHPDTYTSLSRVLPMLWANVINNNIDSADYKNLANKVITSANSGNLDIKACEELRTKLAELTADTELIKQDENKNFVQEITPWLNKFKSYSLMFDKLLNTAEEADSNKAQKLYDEYLQLKSEANENTAVVSRKVIAPVFNAVQRYIVSKNGYTPEITIKTNLKTHENYNLENAVDGDRLTFFWGYNEEANSTYNEKINILTGDYVEVDLGRPKSVTEIEILADDNWRTNYLHNAILQYSVDGKTFTNIGGSFTEPEIKLTELNITARYIRYTSTMQQDQWLILREFTVKTA